MNSTSEIFAIIPARGGSKGVPRKNIKLLGEHPLIAFSIAAALKVPGIKRVIVSTDSQEIGDVSRKYGAEVPFLRPAEFSGDRSTDFDVMKHALDWFRTQEKRMPDYLVHLRPTTPLRDPALVGDAVSRFINGDASTALRSAHEMPESAYKTFEVDGGYFKTVVGGSFDLDAANQARQKFPKTYSPNGYVDVLRSQFILESGKMHGNKVMSCLTPEVTEVDTAADFEYLEYQIKGAGSALYQKIFS